MTALASNKRQFKCRVCERVVERKSRQQNFCSTRCRMKASRASGASKTEARYPYSGSVTDPPKFDNKNNILQWPKTGSSLSANGPINLLGGGSWKWPERGQLGSKTLAKIQWCEVGGEPMEPPE